MSSSWKDVSSSNEESGVAGVCLRQGEPLQSAGPSPMATGNILISQELGHRAYDQNVYNYFKQILNLSNEQYEKTSLSLGEDVDKDITNKGLITRIFVELQIKENNPINKKTKQTKVVIYRAQLHQNLGKYKIKKTTR